MVLQQFKMWFASFMAKRELDVLGGDRRALYKYQMTDDELKNLKKLFSGYYQKPSLTRALQQFYGASYCLLASEFYRREYNRDNGWSWDAIDKFTGVKVKISSKDRDNLMESGLQYWRLKVPQHVQGYLGWLLCQGGLPWRLCQKENDIIFMTIKRLLENYNIEKQRSGGLIPFIEREVEAAKNLWPKFQKNIETYQIIADIVETLINLRTEFPGLENTDDPYTFLDRHKNKWRESFPIPLDEKNAIGIVNEWFKDASKQVREKEKIKSGNDSSSSQTLASKIIWNKQYSSNIVENLKTEVLFPKSLMLKGEKYRHLTSGRYELMFYEGDNLIAKSGVLLGRINHSSNSTKLEFSNIKPAYAFRRHHLEKLIKICLMNNGVTIDEYSLDDSMVDINQPLAFVRRDNQYILISDSSISIEEDKLQVRIPVLNYSLSTDEGRYDILNQYDNFSWVEITSNSTLFLPEKNEQFYYGISVLTGSDKPFLEGELLQNISSSRSCYLGFPELKNIELPYQEYVNGRTITTLDKLKIIGNVNYQVKNKDGQILLTRRFAVINQNISLKTGPLYIDESNAKFTLQVKIFKSSDITTDGFVNYAQTINQYLPDQVLGINLLNQEEIDHQDYLERIYFFEINNLKDIVYRVNVQVKSSYHSESLDLRLLLHPHDMTILENETPIKIDKELPLMLDDLLRYELRVSGIKGEDIELTYELYSQKVKQTLKVTKKILLVNNFLSISLFGIKDEVVNILSVIDDLDAHVKVSFVYHNIGINFDIKHYDSSAKFYVNGSFAPFPACLYLQNITVEEIMEMEWLFVPLITPDKFYPLTIDETKSLADGMFIRFKEKIESEPLGLIMTSENSLYSIRPIYISDQSSLRSVRKNLDTTSIEYAVAMYDPKASKIFVPMMNKMLENHKSPNWNYFKNFPHSKLLHYPLSTFEAWKALARNHKLLASAAIKFGWDDFFCQRIQDELGVVFEAIPIEFWKEPVREIFVKALENNMCPNNLMTMIQDRIAPIENMSLTKNILIRYVFEQNNTGEEENNDEVLYLQKLREGLRAKTSQWPSILAEDLKSWFEKNSYHFRMDESFTKLLSADRKNIAEYAVLLLPVYMAGIAFRICNFKDILDDEYFSFIRARVKFYELKFIIEEIKAFDREWYEACYWYVLNNLIRKK